MVKSANHLIYFSIVFYCRKREEEKKREVLTNPVKMKKIKEMVKLQFNFTYLNWFIFVLLLFILTF